MKPQDALNAIAVDLTASLTSADRHNRLLDVVRKTIPCDAAALLRLDGEEFVPLAAYGLVPEVATLRFAPRRHPRLEVLLTKRAPVLFPPDSELPDPFDGLLAEQTEIRGRIHACLACPLMDGERIVGALTVDATEPHAFDHLDPTFLEILGALAGAALKTGTLIEALERHAERHSLVARDLQRVANERSGVNIIGTSPGIEKMRREIDLVADSDFSVLILGETGVGKELVARAIHAQSRRRHDPLIYVNCAALPETLAESELFGHVRGAFTGATSNRAGKFEVADGGTLLLDEVGELPVSIQAKLLRAFQEGEIQRVGSDKPLKVNVRLLAATNRDLEAEVKRGRFRADLYHRLLVYPIRVPPLRERREDILLLARVFVDEHRRRLGIDQVDIAESAERLMVSNPWPGNVRELNHLLGRAILRAKAESENRHRALITSRHLDLSSPKAAGTPLGKVDEHRILPEGSNTLTAALGAYRSNLVAAALDKTGGNRAAAARLLGMDRSNFHHLAKRLRIQAK